MTPPRAALAGLAVLVAGVALASPSRAATPTEQVRVSIDRVLKILQDPELKKPDQAEARRKQIRAVANELFDWQETGKRALGRHWGARTAAERQEFSMLFADLIERSYVGKIDAYAGEKILYVGEVVEGDQASVRTRLATRSNTEIPIDYRLYKDGDRWRAYDVLVEGISLVGNYRSQFNKIISQSGYDDLIRKMKTKQEELLYEEATRGKKTP